jgi:nucleotide-binding universal stress UspA family protein
VTHLQEPRIEHILIPLDGSTRAEDAIEPALALGSSTHARYTLLQAIEPLSVGFAPSAARLSEQFLQEWHASARSYLESIAAPLRHAGHGVATQTVALPAALAIVEGAQQYHADMIVMSSHGRSGVARLLLGSVADKVVRSATVPVFIQPVHTMQTDLDAELAAENTHATAHSR